MLTNTLTSLAILKVNLDHKRDYLDQFEPFIIQILLDNELKDITVENVSKYIDEKFGLTIPVKTVELILKRITRRYPVKKSHGSYNIIGQLPNPKIDIKRQKAKEHLDFAVTGLQDFSQDTLRPISDREEAVALICSFLTKFDITCLRAYLQGTAIPKLKEDNPADFILISNYIKHIQQNDIERFNSFLVFVQGNMLANALLCPDLHNAPKTYKNVTFYFDTSLIIKLLGFDGKSSQYAANELVDLIRNLGGKIAIFSHTFMEVKNVVLSAAEYIDSPEGRGGIVLEARRTGTSRSDLIIEAELIEQRFDEVGIEIENSPIPINKFQIDELKLEEELIRRRVFWRDNIQAREYDIKSVQSIYTIRANKSILSLEKSQAILVTDNEEFAKVAWSFGKTYSASSYVSSVITDFALANVAWLKRPMGAPSLPKAQVLAISYAALTPPEGFLKKLLKEIDKLQKEGKISEHKHQLAKITPAIREELMQFTLGQDTALTEETILHTIDHVYTEIKREEIEKLVEEQEAHKQTKQVFHHRVTEESQKLIKEQKAHEETKLDIAKKLYWKCDARAEVFSKILSYGSLTLLSIIIIIGFLPELEIHLPDALAWAPPYKNVVLTFCAFVNSIYGITINKVKEKIKKWRLNRLVDRESKITGLDVHAIDT